MREPPYVYNPVRRLKQGGFIESVVLVISVCFYEKVCLTSLGLGVVSAIAFTLNGYPALSQGREAPPVEKSEPTVQQRTGLEGSARSLSKFEARRIRHRCQDQANASGAQGVNKTLVSRHCFRTQIEVRLLAAKCRRLLRDANADKATKQEMIKGCIRDNLAHTQSDPAKDR